MGFFKKLFGIGAAAGGTVAAVKVAQKVKENHPDGVGDLNEDGTVDYKDYVEATKQAAAEVYDEVSEKAKEVSAELKDKAQEAIDKAKEEAGDVVDAAEEQA